MKFAGDGGPNAHMLDRARLWRAIDCKSEHVRLIHMSVARLKGGRWRRLLVACRFRRPDPHIALLVEDAEWTENEIRRLRYLVTRAA